MSNELMANVVGSLAGLCSMASFVPQIIKIVRERVAAGVSLRMFAVTVVAFSLWSIYGLFLQSWPIAISNGICLALTATILALRLKLGDGDAAN